MLRGLSLIGQPKIGPNGEKMAPENNIELEEKRVTPKRGYEYTCPDCYSYWCFTKPQEYFYCLSHTCNNKDDLAIIGFEVVSLE